MNSKILLENINEIIINIKNTKILNKKEILNIEDIVEYIFNKNKKEKELNISLKEFIKNKLYIENNKIIINDKIYIINIKHFLKENFIYLTDITIKEKKIIDCKKEYYKLKEIVYKDSLTDLFNRKKLLHDIKNETFKSIMVFNIDNFREINNFYGFKIGDYVLIELGKKLEEIKGYDFVLYKLHSDEFALLSNTISNVSLLQTEAIRIINTIISNKFLIENNYISLSLSCGISNEKNDLLSTSDMALKSAKIRMKEVIIYQEKFNMKTQYENNINWANNIRTAILENNVIPFFQPIINNKTKKIEKYETLIRIINKDNEIITPYHFLNIAKKTRQYTLLTKIILEKSFATFDKEEYDFSVNLSFQDMVNEEIINHINILLEKYNVKNKVIFEILEDDSIRNYNEVYEFITMMKKKGIRFALDDFGSGYSNFEHVLKLNVDFLKIDGSLIKDIHKDDNKRIIVSTIVDFAKKMNMKTVAEFVSDKEIFEETLNLGINYSQGFYFYKPCEHLNKD